MADTINITVDGDDVLEVDVSESNAVTVTVEDPTPTISFTLSESAGGGVSVHSGLSGLAADDHTQYSLADGSRWTGTPTANRLAASNASGNLVASDIVFNDATNSVDFGNNYVWVKDAAAGGSLFLGSAINRAVLYDLEASNLFQIQRSGGKIKLVGGTAIEFQAAAGTVFSLPSADSSAGAVMVTDGAGALSLQGKAYVDARDFGVTADGVTDDTTALQNAIDAAASGGFSRVVLPEGTIIVSSTIEITTSNIFIEGQGGSWTANTGAALDRAKTILSWGGAAGGRMMSIITPDVAATPKIYGGGVKGIMFYANAGCAEGLVISTVVGGKYEDLYFRDFSTAGLTVTTIDPVVNLDDPADTQYCNFERITTRNYVNTGTGIKIMGGTTLAGDGNTSMNFFNNIECFHLDGTGLYFGNSDHNILNRVRVFRAAGGTGEGVVLDGASISGAGHARRNIFILLTSVAGILSRGTTTYPGGQAAIDNKIIFYDKGNASPDPVLETGASIIWDDSTGYSHTHKFVDAVFGENKTNAQFARDNFTNAAIEATAGGQNHIRLKTVTGGHDYQIGVSATTGQFRIYPVAGGGTFQFGSASTHTFDFVGQLKVGAPTGSHKGYGSINASTIYENNVRVALKSATSVTGSRSSGAALQNLLTVLAAAGIITDDTTA